MAISIPGLCVALKDAQSCAIPLQIATKLQQYFNSKVTAYLLGGDKSGLPPTFTVNQLESVKEVNKAFKHSEADLLILSLKAEDTGNGIVNAAEANKLIDSIERMVLTVPCSASGYNFSKIVVPIDSSFETRQKVPYAISMAKAFGATLCVVGVSSHDNKDTEVLIKNYLRQVCTNIEEKGVPVVSDMRLGGNPTQIVLDFAKEISAGLVVIMTEQETNFTSFFSGKYSQQMIKNSTIPVLSIHPKDLIVSEARL